MGETLGVAVRTLGCKVNQAESDAIASALAASGTIAAAEDDARVVVINTCTVTGEADHKARKAIRHALGLPGAPTVVVTGCLAAIDPVGVASLGDRVIVEPAKDRVAARVAAILGTTDLQVVTRGGASGLSRTRVQVKVQDGCDTFCAYCIVPYARGVPRSVPAAEVVGRVRELVEAGVAEVVLTGINIGRYDADGVTLPGLVEAVASTGVPRLRLSSIEPGDVSEELLAVAASTSAFCRHLHIPLQSGSDVTLAAMARPYDAGTYAEVLARVRAVLPGVALSSDVMVGFPGESPSDDEESRAFVDSVGFARLHVFRYSARAGTPAAERADQVPASVKAERASAMRATGTAGAARFLACAVGSHVEMLVERVVTGDRDATLVAEGVTREYLRVRTSSESARPGDLLAVAIEGPACDGVVRGRIVV
ncbi:MAG: MiaB/RimO family radical SAM methylthiotransferase [Coriobacteriia bacterium]|nr:MiaB/RimO family radical SAM methylthiotransferase [Coriobacteriia bacterium]